MFFKLLIELQKSYSDNISQYAYYKTTTYFQTDTEFYRSRLPDLQWETLYHLSLWAMTNIFVNMYLAKIKEGKEDVDGLF